MGNKRRKLSKRLRAFSSAMRSSFFEHHQQVIHVYYPSICPSCNCVIRTLPWQLRSAWTFRPLFVWLQWCVSTSRYFALNVLICEPRLFGSDMPNIDVTRQLCLSNSNPRDYAFSCSSQHYNTKRLCPCVAWQYENSKCCCCHGCSSFRVSIHFECLFLSIHFNDIECFSFALCDKVQTNQGRRFIFSKQKNQL